MSSTTIDCEQDRLGTAADFQCPKCGRVIPCASHGPPKHPTCPDCNTLLWCRKRVELESILLYAIPGTTPEIHDIATVGKSLQLSRTLRDVVVNLCDLATINSSFVAGLLVMRRLIESAGVKFILCAPPHVRTILQRLQVHTLFTIKSCDQDGMNAV